MFWACTHTPLVQIRENPEFHDMPQRDRIECLSWMHAWAWMVDRPLMVLGCISVGLLVLDRLLQSGGKLAQVLTLLAFCILDECIPADGHVAANPAGRSRKSLMS